MSKIIRVNQLDKYSINGEVIIFNKKKKTKKFRDLEEQKKKTVKKD